MDKADERLAYEYLLELYRDMLIRRVREDENSLISNGIATEMELKSQADSYFGRTCQSLQSLYSKYNGQWNALNQCELKNDQEMLIFLSQMRYNFVRFYDVEEFNIDYHLQNLKRYRIRTAEFATQRNIFMQKWRRLLYDMEFNFQMQHINRLCDEFCAEQARIYKKVRLKFAIGSGGKLSRLMYLLRDEKEEVIDEIFEYKRYAEKSCKVKEIVEKIGREQSVRKRNHAAKSGSKNGWTTRHATHSDIVGIVEGNNITSLLPIEYAFLSDKELQPIFMRKMREKKLQVFEYASKERARLDRTNQKGNEAEEPERKGPFIICVDTSASMMGYAEVMSKSIILAIAEMNDARQRPFHIINFSENISTITIRNLELDFMKLVHFLCISFHKGSDIAPAVEDAVKKMEEADFNTADLLILSDFRLDPMRDDTWARLKRQKQKGMRIFDIAFDPPESNDYLKCADEIFNL
ncbi:MAG: VWA domain-containing protein [Bacteroidaceae bacterium]|nr:VWA domain-containing protein [Bacteroidaceae bacterium]